MEEKPVQRDSAKKNDRYSRRELIGVGAFKTVYKAYDAEEGREVAWNQVKLSNVKKQTREKILTEIAILEQLHHERIMSIYDSWESEDGKLLIFITEIMSSGTLKDFLNKAKKIKMRNVKKWCKQILQGLFYLHRTDPHPIIHRDLKCDNIFMNGNRSEVKIGDLGLSISMKDKKFAVSVIGTPEFMAPELYDEHYTEKIDIYAFGMCVLEMVTGDYPYCECENPAQVFRRVSQGIKPKALDNIQDELTKEFIKVCLLSSDKRPTAEALLAHPFFSSERNNDITLYFDNDDEEDEDLLSPRKSFSQTETPADQIRSDEIDYTRVVVDELPEEGQDIIVLKVFLNLEGAYKQIKFPYNKHEDTPDDVSSEMSRKFCLSPQHNNKISNGIANTIEELEKGNVILAEDLALGDIEKDNDEFVLDDDDDDGDDFSSNQSVTSDDIIDDTSTTPSNLLTEDTERPKSAPTPDATAIDESVHSDPDEKLNSTHVDSLHVEVTSRDGDSISSAPDNLESVTMDGTLKGNQNDVDKKEPDISSELGSNSEIHDLSDLKELPKAAQLPDLTLGLHSKRDTNSFLKADDVKGPTSPRSETPAEMINRQHDIYLQTRLSIEQKYQKQIDTLKERIVNLQRQRDDEMYRLRHQSDAINTSPLSQQSATSLPIDAFSFSPADEDNIGNKESYQQSTKYADDNPKPSPNGKTIQDKSPSKTQEAKVKTNHSNVATQDKMANHASIPDGTSKPEPQNIPKSSVQKPKSIPRPTNTNPTHSQTHSNTKQASTHPNSQSSKSHQPKSTPQVVTKYMQAPLPKHHSSDSLRKSKKSESSTHNNMRNGSIPNTASQQTIHPEGHSAPASTRSNSIRMISPPPNRLNHSSNSRMPFVDNFDSLVNVMKDSLRKAEENSGNRAPTLSQLKSLSE